MIDKPLRPTPPRGRRDRAHGRTAPRSTDSGTGPRPTPPEGCQDSADGGTLRANWRKEILYLGLAAMESCWLYPWLLMLTPGSGEKAQHIPFAALLSTLLLALYLTRLLSWEAVPLLIQRIATIVLAFLSSLVLLRLYVYVDYSVRDMSWLRHFAWEVGNVLQRISPSLVIFFAGFYLWWRGISLAQRELGVESVGFSFRMGIITFFWFLAVTIFGSRIDATPFIFAYFFLGLVVMGLARIEDVSQSRIGIRSPFNASWMGILAGSTLVVAALSILAASLLSLRSLTALLKQLHPVVVLLGKIAYPVLVAMAWLLQLILASLIRIFRSAWGAKGLEPLGNFSEQLEEFRQIGEPAQGPPPLILQVLLWGFLGFAFVAVLTVLAFSINRRWRALQAGPTGEHESVWEAESAAKGVRDALESRWQRLREELQAQLARLRGEEYSLVSIRHIYASLVKLATASGFPRHEAQTPYEYITTLHRSFPGSDEEITLITDAYVRTHYGQRLFRAAYVQRVRDAWLAIRTRQEQGSRN